MHWTEILPDDNDKFDPKGGAWTLNFSFLCKRRKCPCPVSPKIALGNLSGLWIMTLLWVGCLQCGNLEEVGGLLWDYWEKVVLNFS